MKTSARWVKVFRFEAFATVSWVILFLVFLPQDGLGETAPPGLSPDRELVHHTVRVGDTCESIAREYYGNARYYYVIVEHNPGAQNILRTTCNNSLVPGAVIELPRRIPQHLRPPDASVTAVIKKVRSRAPTTPSWSKAHPGQELFKGWRVNTLESSEAQLTFRDRSQVHLREETLVIIYGPSVTATRRRTSKATLERGILRSRLGELSGRKRLDLLTPTAKAELHGGEAVVAVDQAQSSTRVSNISGRPAKVYNRKGGNPVVVRAGMGTTVRKGKRPTEPRHLLAAPRWNTEDPELFVSVEGLGQSYMSGSFSAGSGASRYRIELSSGTAGDVPVGSTSVPGHVARFELRGFPLGTYHATVSAIDDDGLEGELSLTRILHLKQLKLIRPDFVKLGSQQSTPHPKNIPQIPAGSSLIAPDGLVCAVGESPAQREIVLSGEGVVSIRCNDLADLTSSRLLVEVTSLALAPFLAKGGEPLTELRRGEPTRIDVCGLDTDRLGTRKLAFSPGPGIHVQDFEVTSRGCLRATIEASLDAPPEAHIAVHLRPRIGRRVVLSLVNFGVDAPLPRPSKRDSQSEINKLSSKNQLSARSSNLWPPPARPVGEAWGLLALNNAFGLRDERRSGNGFFTSLGYEGSFDGKKAGFLSSLGLRLGFFQERLALELAFPLPSEPDTGSLAFSLSSLVIAGPILGLAVELTTWFPFSIDETLQRYSIRLVPSVHLSFRIGRRITLRTRQGFLADAGAGGLLSWASAYGTDIWIGGPISMSFEGEILLGSSGGDFLLMPALGLSLGLELGQLFLSFGTRFNPTTEALDQPGGVMGVMTLRSSFSRH